MHVLTVFGVSAGVHRLWSHKSYKAKLPLRILLVLFFSAAGQASLVLNSTYNYYDSYFYVGTSWYLLSECDTCASSSSICNLQNLALDLCKIYDKNILNTVFL